jgi:tryptophan synthase alpha chain
MSRLAARFETLRREGRRALIPFVTAGDPSPALTVPLMRRMVGGGADVIELGIPFSDPMAEGPTIQKACERALAHGVRLIDVLDMVREFRAGDADTPVVLMGYLNPIEVTGYEQFARAARAAGVDGVITVDLPPEEAADYVAALRAEQLDPVFLVSPTTSESRMERISESSGGFLYYVSLRGVTGAANLDVGEVGRRLALIRRHTKLPIGVGFGINDAESAASVASVADAVIVGSALVKRIAAAGDNADALLDDVGAFVSELRSAVDRVEPQRAVENV